MGQNLHDHRRINLWNVFIRAKLCEVNAGDRVKLMQFVAQNKDDLLVAYKNLTLAQQEAYNAEVQVARDTKVMIMCSNPKAISHTVSAAFANMDWEVRLFFSVTFSHYDWNASGLRCVRKPGLEGFYIAVRGTVEDLFGAEGFFHPKSREFCSDSLLLESWTCPTLTKYQCPLNKLISECCALIQEELDYLLTKKKVSTNVKMNYTNYERQIVERYGVMLTGWPFSDWWPGRGGEAT
ncbi:hypothetical protein EDD16DRAFT_1697402 [Pisolithus croceorrhizus]|nr:hypothetical protein EDD16DRAFT_1697402 [Pisolithus croceorrhizus]